MLCRNEFWEHEIKSVCEIKTVLITFHQPISFTLLMYILLLFLFMLSLLFNSVYTIQSLYFETQFVSEELRTSSITHNINQLRFSLACHLWHLFIYLFIYSFILSFVHSFFCPFFHSFILQSMIYFHSTYFGSMLEQIMQQNLKLWLQKLTS